MGGALEVAFCDPASTRVGGLDLQKAVVLPASSTPAPKQAKAGVVEVRLGTVPPSGAFAPDGDFTLVDAAGNEVHVWLAPGGATEKRAIVAAALRPIAWESSVCPKDTGDVESLEHNAFGWLRPVGAGVAVQPADGWITDRPGADPIGRVVRYVDEAAFTAQFGHRDSWALVRDRMIDALEHDDRRTASAFAVTLGDRGWDAWAAAIASGRPLVTDRAGLLAVARSGADPIEVRGRVRAEAPVHDVAMVLLAHRLYHATFAADWPAPVEGIADTPLAPDAALAWVVPSETPLAASVQAEPGYATSAREALRAWLEHDAAVAEAEGRFATAISEGLLVAELTASDSPARTAAHTRAATLARTWLRTLAPTTGDVVTNPLIEHTALAAPWRFTPEMRPWTYKKAGDKRSLTSGVTVTLSRPESATAPATVASAVLVTVENVPSAYAAALSAPPAPASETRARVIAGLADDVATVDKAIAALGSAPPGLVIDAEARARSDEVLASLRFTRQELMDTATALQDGGPIAGSALPTLPLRRVDYVGTVERSCTTYTFRAKGARWVGRIDDAPDQPFDETVRTLPHCDGPNSAPLTEADARAEIEARLKAGAPPWAADRATSVEAAWTAALGTNVAAHLARWEVKNPTEAMWTRYWFALDAAGPRGAAPYDPLSHARLVVPREPGDEACAFWSSLPSP